MSDFRLKVFYTVARRLNFTKAAEELLISQPAVTKPLRELREAGFLESRLDAQRPPYRLRPEPLMELDDWLEPYRKFWSTHLDALERHLDLMAKKPNTKRTRRR